MNGAPASTHPAKDACLDGQVAVIVGTGSGVGGRLAEALAQRGACLAPDDPGEDVAATADTAFGRVDIVVTVTRLAPEKVTLSGVTPDGLETALELVLRRTFDRLRPAWIAMRRQGYGRVVNVMPADGLSGAAPPHHSAAAAGLIGLTRVLAGEGRRYGINVNAVCVNGLGGDDSLATEFLARLTVHLAGAGCAATGELFAVGAEGVSRTFIGLTQGYYDPGLTPEAVRDHFDVIRSPERFTVPGSPSEEFAKILGLFTPDTEGA